MPMQERPNRAAGSVVRATGSLALQHAVDAVLWGMPIVSFDAMRQAFFRDAGAAPHDLVYWSKVADWKLQLTTPNASAHYAWAQIDTRQGPLVLEVPAAVGAGLFGSILDAWQVPMADVGPHGADAGKGGSYLLLPPGFQGDVPPGKIAIRLATFGGYAAFRAIPEGASEAARNQALALIRRLRLYPLANVAPPPQQRFIDMSGRLFDGIVRFDDSYFARLARMIDEEPALPRDAPMLDQLRALGIDQGKPFAPDAALRDLLGDAARTAHNSLVTATAAEGAAYWPNRRWRTPSTVGAKTGFTFVTDDGSLDVNARALTYFLACAPPATLGKASFYLAAFADRAGQVLTGDRTYRLHVPSHVPAAQFWAATVYDRETAAFVREAPRVEVNSYAAHQTNPDGSVDLYFGPAPPAGKDANWVYTAPDAAWFTLFRFYGPTAPLLDKRWQLTDFDTIDAEV